MNTAPSVHTAECYSAVRQAGRKEGRADHTATQMSLEKDDEEREKPDTKGHTVYTHICIKRPARQIQTREVEWRWPGAAVEMRVNCKRAGEAWEGRRNYSETRSGDECTDSSVTGLKPLNRTLSGYVSCMVRDSYRNKTSHKNSTCNTLTGNTSNPHSGGLPAEHKPPYFPALTRV